MLLVGQAKAVSLESSRSPTQFSTPPSAYANTHGPLSSKTFTDPSKLSPSHFYDTPWQGEVNKQHTDYLHEMGRKRKEEQPVLSMLKGHDHKSPEQRAQEKQSTVRSIMDNYHTNSIQLDYNALKRKDSELSLTAPQGRQAEADRLSYRPYPSYRQLPKHEQVDTVEESAGDEIAHGGYTARSHELDHLDLEHFKRIAMDPGSAHENPNDLYDKYSDATLGRQGRLQAIVESAKGRYMAEHGGHELTNSQLDAHLSRMMKDAGLHKPQYHRDKDGKLVIG